MIAYSEFSRDARIRRESEALQELGYNVDFFVLQEDDESPVVTNVNLLPLKLKQYRGNSNIKYIVSYLNFFLQAFFRLIWLYPNRRYRLIFTHNMPDFIVFLGFFPKLFGCKLIHDIHDLMPDIYKSKFRSSLSGIIYYLLLLQEKLSCLIVDKIITVSDIGMEILTNSHKIPKRKIAVVRNFADKKLFYPKKKALARKRKEFLLIHHGTISDRFGLDYILNEMKTICKKHDYVKLHIYGKGDGHEEYKLAEIINKHSLEKNVFLHGQIALDEIPNKIAESNLGIVSYKEDEITDIFTPLKLLEYIAMEIPLVTVKTKAISMLVKDAKLVYYKNGIEGSFSTAISTILTRNQLLEDLTHEVVALNTRINWQKEKVVLQTIVKNLISS